MYLLESPQSETHKFYGELLKIMIYHFDSTPDFPILLQYMSRVVRKPAFCICENKDVDQLRGNREVDQHLCFRYTDSTIPLLPKFQASNHLLRLYSLVCVIPGRKPRRPVFSQLGSYVRCKLGVTFIRRCSCDAL